ncbi:unnamed protein product, partial [Acanthoscelides obtectus]
NEPLEERQQHDEEPISDYDDSDADPNYEPSVSPRRKKIKFSDFDDVSLAPLKSRQPLKKVNENVNANCRVSQERADKQEKHPLLLSCHNNCRQKCSSKINDENFRELIRTKFWRLSFGERRLFLDAHIKQFEIKVRRQEAQRSSRNVSLKYFLPLPVETEAKFEKIQVCKTMFLHTLGLKTDGMITCHIHSKKRSVEGIAQTVDERGLVVFNETFASLHKDGNICVMWHEAIRGRSATDVASAYYNEVEFLKKKVDLKFPIHPFVEPLGLNSDKRETILKKLVPSFKDERKKLFWQFLPSNDNSKDLCVVSEA